MNEVLDPEIVKIAHNDIPAGADMPINRLTPGVKDDIFYQSRTGAPHGFPIAIIPTFPA